ncbi:hypothetical protein DFJ73DRAFT_623314 [Zopfochytrium polystomum]|nr:hypothetical protein DFJ73DRAFT_623314 [Zopfochytrium polystomum]
MFTIETFPSWGRKIVAIGRNYAEHAKELGNAVPKAPFFFLKPPSSYVRHPDPIELPAGVNVHHEVELGVVIGKRGRDVSVANAYDFVDGYVLAIDLTARDLQDAAKKEGKPWSAAKGFDTFTPIGEFIPKEKIPDPHNLHLWLRVDEQIRQDGNTKDMIFDIPTLITHVSSIMHLERGDVILTGTPSGVGPFGPGSIITAGLRPIGHKGDLSTVKFTAIARPGELLVGLYRLGLMHHKVLVSMAPGGNFRHK